jgi:neutral ceramidase
VRIEQRETREIIGVLFNFTGHPVILGSRNLKLTGEFPGWASRTVEQVLGGVAVFTQGACGDITVHRDGDPWLEIQRLGRLVAGEVIKTAEFIRPAEDVTVDAASTPLTFPPKPIPPAEESKTKVAEAEANYEEAVKADAPEPLQRQLRQKVDLHSASVRQAELIAEGRLELPESYEAEVQVLRIGDAVIVTAPGELFVEYALELRQRIAQTFNRPMMLVGYANDYIGYIVTPRAMQTGGYEASVARVGPEAGREIVETAMALLSSL